MPTTAFHAAASYDEATARLTRLEARDAFALHPGCATTALLVGHATPRAFVLLHGLTNCPLQFLTLAESLRAEGDNVVVPRVDHHGLADRMTADLASLKAEELAALVTECVGIARGLGDTVVVGGLSTSGVVAAWAAANLPAVDRAVAIAPAFAPHGIPAWLASDVTRLALHLPNRFVWWSSMKDHDTTGPQQCYYRFSTRALGEAYRLGEIARSVAGRSGARAHEVDLVTSEADEAVDAGAVRWFASRCQARGARLRTYVFPAAARVVHDMIDPAQTGARVDVVYPVLLALLRGQALPPAATASRVP